MRRKLGHSSDERQAHTHDVLAVVETAISLAYCVALYFSLLILLLPVVPSIRLTCPPLPPPPLLPPSPHHVVD